MKYSNGVTVIRNCLLLFIFLLPGYLRADNPKILTHYMPWYQSPAVSGYWGWHWTMNHYNPDVILPNGQRQIASHFYPLTGPYDSRDDDILEYQVLSMKISGIDGVLVDWYGMANFWDYGTLNQSTQELFSWIKKAQLEFAICYEDQSIGHMVNSGFIPASSAISHAQSVMLYMQSNWMNDPAYARLNGQPVLFIFGPQYFYSSAEWETIFSVMSTSPAFFTLNNRLAPVAQGAYPWPPMWASENGVLSMTALNSYLIGFYEQAAEWPAAGGSAFPGFHDIYSEAGVGDSYGYLDAQGTFTFESTLNSAVSQNPEIIQLVTWNDYGEGTIIEPTAEFGTAYLEIVQNVVRTNYSPGFQYIGEHLQIPMEILQLRREYWYSTAVNNVLDDVFDLVVAGQMTVAKAKIDSINGVNDINDPTVKRPEQFQLLNAYPIPSIRPLKLCWKYR